MKIPTDRKFLAALACALAALAYAGYLRCSRAAPVVRRGFASWAQQGQAATTSLAGTIDPTSPAGWLGTSGMVACTSSCSDALALQNSQAMQNTLAYANANQRAVYVPPGRYPMMRQTSQEYGVDLSGYTFVEVTAYGARFVLQGDQAASAGEIFWIRNASHVRIEGAHFEMNTSGVNPISTTALVKVGDGGTTTADDVKFTDVVFTAATDGDCLRADGGSSAATVTRLQLLRATRFETCDEAVHLKGGIDGVTISHDWFRNNTSRDVWLELSGSLGPTNVTILNVAFERLASPTVPASLDLTGSRVVVRYSKVTNGTILGAALSDSWITDNPLLKWNYTGAGAVVALSGAISNVHVERNYVYRGTSATNGPLIQVTDDGASAPADVWVCSNRVLQYSGSGAGVDVTSSGRATVTDNSISYHAATADSGATGFVGVKCQGSSTQKCSGIIARNSVTKRKQIDGTTDAGRMLAGIDLRKGGASAVGLITMRDNDVSGAASTFYSDADGSSEWPDGYPVIDGNISTSVATEGFVGGTTTWVPQTTPVAETKTTGALDVTRTISYVTTANTVAYTLAAANQDGFVHCVKITAVSGTPAGTLTPVAMADGTTHTLTWSAAGGFACLVWDATGATYRLRGSSGVTLN